VTDDEGSVLNATLRNYRIPAFADIPRTEIFYADTYDSVGPLGAKAMGESSIVPVSAAIANAIKDAIGVRLTSLPLSADRIYDALYGGEPQFQRPAQANVRPQNAGTGTAIGRP
jgi:CO/xanthine dehydrogenase Mo-binding subunit